MSLEYCLLVVCSSVGFYVEVVRGADKKLAPVVPNFRHVILRHAYVHLIRRPAQLLSSALVVSYFSLLIIKLIDSSVFFSP